MGKTMTNSTGTNMCRRALLNEENTCNGQDLLTECETWCRELDLPNVTKGCLDTALIKTAVWAKMKPKIGQKQKTDILMTEKKEII